MSEQNRCGHARTLTECRQQIDEMLMARRNFNDDCPHQS